MQCNAVGISVLFCLFSYRIELQLMISVLIVILFKNRHVKFKYSATPSFQEHFISIYDLIVVLILFYSLVNIPSYYLCVRVNMHLLVCFC